MLELTITSMILHHALYMTCILREKSTSRKEWFCTCWNSPHLITSTVFSLTHFEDRCKTSSTPQSTFYMLLLLKFSRNAKIKMKLPEIYCWKNSITNTLTQIGICINACKILKIQDKVSEVKKCKWITT